MILTLFQDWLDPDASPEYPEKALADNHPVASAFLVKTFDLMSESPER